MASSISVLTRTSLWVKSVCMKFWTQLFVFPCVKQTLRKRDCLCRKLFYLVCYCLSRLVLQLFSFFIFRSFHYHLLQLLTSFPVFKLHVSPTSKNVCVENSLVYSVTACLALFYKSFLSSFFVASTIICFNSLRPFRCLNSM